ncbi:unnamed protein product [Adineta steineri]|uniref:Uncharacterized protein n=1 Tax=Adineta steineri TaxID=433720 RepID=A0A818ICK0_9BILA|nr:unnamed protein product [Adineta steineri]
MNPSGQKHLFLIILISDFLPNKHQQVETVVGEIILHIPESLQTILLHKILAKSMEKKMNNNLLILHSSCPHCRPIKPAGQIHEPVYESQIP